MNTIGWLLLLTGIVVARAVAKGRAAYLGTDLADGFLALIRGDTKALDEVVSREGDGNTAGEADSSGLTGRKVDNPVKTAAIADTAIALGGKAKGYKWTGVGPDYYDCSGLMWRACQAVGYKGDRFTTSTMLNNNAFIVIEKSVAGRNDMVLWKPGEGGLTGHMGVITGDDTFYSARSVRSGIGYAKISNFRSVKPTYVRYVGPKKG